MFEMNINTKPLILVIVNNIDLIKQIGNFLRKEGYRIAIATETNGVVDLCHNIKPDLILLDTDTAGTNGFEICKELKTKLATSDIPIISITSKINSNEILYAFNAGCNDYIIKPFDPTELLVRINTHIKLNRYKLEIVEKNKQLERLNIEKNELLGIAAHDLKNPIYSIAMLAKVIKNEKSLTKEEIEEFASDIITTSERMLVLISNLLDLNKIDLGQVILKPEEINLKELLFSIIEIYKDRARLKNIKINFHSDNDFPITISDRNALFQVFDNLVSNAIKYSFINREIFININTSEYKYIISIQDQGPGIREEEMPKLFQKFSRLSSKPTGDEDSTGLGLSIVKRYVDMLNGHVYCKSIYGKGSIFYVELPIKK